MKLPRPSRAKTLLTAGRLAGRRLFRREAGERDRELGELLTAELDAMKGLAMKVGQIVSYMGVPLPEEVEQTMAKLQTGIHGMKAEEMRGVFVDVFGLGPEELFERFDDHPIAAASIGQVHRASFESREVAVKVRYPHVDKEFKDDVRVIDRIASLASLASSVDGKMIVQELALRLAEECDYLQEGKWQDAFRGAFADKVGCEVPEVIWPRTAKSVLTTEWIDGQIFADICGEPDDTIRAQAARTLVYFAYRSLLVLAAIQADPHPGNYLFRPDGSVCFLDFGCVRSFTHDTVELTRRQIKSLQENDNANFRETCHQLGFVGNAKRFDFEYFRRVMEHLYQPFLHNRFCIDASHVKEGFDLNGPKNPNARHLSIQGEQIWIMRLQWGLWSVIAKLRVELDFRGILEEVMGEDVQVLQIRS